MRKILFVLGLFMAFAADSQPLNYTRIANRYRWVSGMFDSALYVPRYNGTPSGVRVGENSAIDGAVAIDTANHRAYIYSGGAWVRLANYAEIPAAYTASNGITLSSNNFKLGGTLIEPTSIDANGQNFTISDAALIGLTAELGGTTYLQTTDGSNITVSESITIAPKLGSLGIDTLNYTLSTTGKKILLRDTATGLVENIDPALITGATPTLQQVITAGATLTGDNTIVNGANTLTISGSAGTPDAVLVVSTSSDGTGAQISSTSGTGATISGASGVSGIGSTGFGLSGASTSSYGVFAQTTSGIPIEGLANPTSTNTQISILNLTRTTSGTAANNIGGSIDYYVELDNNGSQISNRLISKWTDAASATRTSQFDITGINSASTETFANFQTGGIVRVNNLADTLATKAYARSVGVPTVGNQGEILQVSNGAAAWKYDTTTLATFSAGARIVTDTTLFTDSTLYGSFYLDGNDTLIITKIRAVMSGNTTYTDTLGYNIYYNDSLNTIGTSAFTATEPITSVTTGDEANADNYTGGAPPFKIPPGNWVWLKTPSVVAGRKPQYLSVSLIGYKKRVN